MTRTRLRSRAAMAAIVLMTAVVGCAIQPDAAPRDIAQDDEAPVGAGDATGDVAAGSNLIFLLAPNEPDEPQLLRSVMRDVARSDDTSAVLRSLFSGPNRGERADGLETAIPQGLAFSSTPRISDGTLTVDVGEGLDELDAVDLRYAVAQIVTTATAIDGVDRVEIRVNGEGRSWPRGDGELTEQPLTPYDFPGVVESTQPAYPTIPSAVR
jgi:spore germination protein GerM